MKANHASINFSNGDILHSSRQGQAKIIFVSDCLSSARVETERERGKSGLG